MGTAGTAAELGIKIVIDSNAQEAFNKVKSGLQEVEDKSEKTKKKLDLSLGGNASKLKSGAAMLAGGYAAAAVAVAGLGVASAHAFQESEKQVRQIANTLTLLDKEGHAFEDIRDYAAGLKDELEDLGMEAGVADDALVKVFNDVLERGNKSVEQAKELTEQMAYAGRAIPGGAEELSNAFEQIQMGIVKAKNPIVGMIASTHTLQGNAKQVAKEMSKMTSEEQMALAEKAIAKMSGKMKDVPLTMGQALTSMKIGFENIFETAGEPMIQHLTPVVRKARDLFMKIQPGLMDMADGFGQRIGQAFDILIPIMEEVYTAFNANASEFKAAFDEASKPFSELFHYIYENKGTFAKTIADVALAIAKAMAKVIEAVGAMHRLIMDTVKFLGKHGPVNWLSGGATGKFIGEEELRGQTKDIRKLVMADANRDPGMEAKDKAKAAYMKTYGETYGEDKVVDGLKDFNTAWNNAVQEHTNVMRVAQESAAAARVGDTQSFVKAWQAATKAQDQGAMTYVSQFLLNNQQLVKALAEEGPKMLGDGFGQLIDTLKEGNWREIADQLKKGPDLKFGSPKVNLNQTFTGPVNVKQDFRDQDPDQIMVMFKGELARAGTTRIQSKLGALYGF